MQLHGIVVAGPSENTVRICHFSPCDSPDSKITLSSIIAFTYGHDLLLFPSKVIRVSPGRFAEARDGKLGFDAKNFNCEHFVNLCITCESVSDMNHEAFGLLLGVSGTLLTVFVGVAGAVAWTAGKKAVVGQIVYDKYMAYDDASSKIFGSTENVMIVPR